MRNAVGSQHSLIGAGPRFQAHRKVRLSTARGTCRASGRQPPTEVPSPVGARAVMAECRLLQRPAPPHAGPFLPLPRLGRRRATPQTQRRLHPCGTTPTLCACRPPERHVFVGLGGFQTCRSLVRFALAAPAFLDAYSVRASQEDGERNGGRRTAVSQSARLP